MKSIKLISIFIFGGIFSFLTFEFFGNLYIYITKPLGSFLGADVTIIMGIPIAYLFSTFFLTSFVFQKLNKWFFVILSIPVIAFEIMFDPLHIYFPFIFGFIGLGLGLSIRTAYFKIKNLREGK